METLDVIRPVAALITALLTGTLVNRLVNAGLDDEPKDAAEPDCCGANGIFTGEEERAGPPADGTPARRC